MPKLLFKDKDGHIVKEVAITKATKVNMDKPIFYIDDTKDGQMRLIWSSGMLDEFSEISTIEVIRDDTG